MEHINAKNVSEEQKIELIKDRLHDIEVTIFELDEEATNLKQELESFNE